MALKLWNMFFQQDPIILCFPLIKETDHLLFLNHRGLLGHCNHIPILLNFHFLLRRRNILQILKFLDLSPGIFNDILREIQHFQYTESITFVTFALFYRIEHSQLIVLNFGSDIEVANPSQFFLQIGHFMEMGGKKTETADMLMNIAGNGPSQAEAIARGGPTA